MADKVTWAAPRILGAMGDPAVLPLLTAPHPRPLPLTDAERIRAILAITGGRGAQEIGAILDKSRYRDTQDLPHLKWYALAAAGDTKALAKAQQFPPRCVTQHWAPTPGNPSRLVVDFPRPELTPILLPSLTDSWHRLYLTAEKLPLVYLSDSSVTRTLTGHLPAASRNRQDLIGTLMILGLRRDRTALPDVARFTGSEEKVIRNVASCAAAALGAVAGFDEIKALLDSPSRYVRASALNALAARWPDSSLALLLVSMSDVSTLVIRVSQMCLTEMDHASIAPALEAVMGDFFLYEGVRYRAFRHDDLLLALAHARSPQALMVDSATGYPYLLDRLRMTRGFEAVRFAEAFEALSGIEIGHKVVAPRWEQVEAIEKAEHWWRETHRSEAR